MLVAQKDVPYISIPTDLTKLTTLLLLEISILLIVLLFVASKWRVPWRTHFFSAEPSKHIPKWVRPATYVATHRVLLFARCPDCNCSFRTPTNLVTLRTSSSCSMAPGPLWQSWQTLWGSTRAGLGGSELDHRPCMHPNLVHPEVWEVISAFFSLYSATSRRASTVGLVLGKNLRFIEHWIFDLVFLKTKSNSNQMKLE